MRNLLTLITILISSSYSTIAQPIKVEGYPGDPYNIITKFHDDYFTVQRNDGYAIINLEGKTISSGIKAPVIGFSRKLPIAYGTIFTAPGNEICASLLEGTATK